jgi:cytochrome c biogenesis protein CcmG/thiol:disulfide interchange protein DsbE
MSKNKARIAAFSAVILAVCAAAWFFAQHAPGERGGDHPGAPQLRPAPAFELKDHSGALHTLAEARGKLVLVHFWAAWCPPCLSEIPDLVELAQKLDENRGKFRVFAISLDEKWEDAEKVLQSAKLPSDMISLLDGGAKIPDLYGTYQYPETYLIDPDGKILAKWVGAQPWSSSQTIELLKGEIAKLK